jgi:FkbM family methyltransferase
MLKNLIILGIRPLLKKRVYTVRNGLAKGLRRKGGLGFLPKPMGAEQLFLANQDFLGKTVYDIGGWEGVFTLFFSRAVGSAGHVVTFEPNPDNRRIIEENLRLNGFGNVMLRPVALGRVAQNATLAVGRNNSGQGSIRQELKSGILEKKGSQIHQVEVDTLDHQIEVRQLPLPDFIKIDVEGMELGVLEGMKETLRRVKPRFLIEVHECGLQDYGDNARAVVEWLLARDYAILHVETGQTVSKTNAAQVLREHIYCT